MASGRARINPLWAALPLELAVGIIFFGHGVQKLTDPSGILAAMPSLGFPEFMAYAAIAAEFGGGLLLLAGLFVRFSAFGHVCVMSVAVSMVHWQSGLMGPEGFEFPLSLLAGSLALLVVGPDPLSIDRNIGLSGLAGNSVHQRRDTTDVTGLRVKAAAVVLLLAGISLPIGRNYVGVSESQTSLVITIAAGVVAVACGFALMMGKQWAFVPAFVVARLMLAGSTILLLWVKYTLRGSVAVAVSLLLLAALRTARRGPA